MLNFALGFALAVTIIYGYSFAFDHFLARRRAYMLKTNQFSEQDLYWLKYGDHVDPRAMARRPQ